MDETVVKPKVRDLFAWKSGSRVSKNYTKEVLPGLGIIALLVSIIFAFFQEWFAILATLGAFFLFYALTKVPPEEVDHKITTEGLVSMGHSYLWSELGPFWFMEKDGQAVLYLAHGNIFGQLIMLVDKKDQEKIKDTLAQYLPYIETPEKSAVEKASDWFSKKFPLEKKN